MLFCTKDFLFFYLAVFCLYWATPNARARVWLLLISSYIFYATWNHWLALLIVVTSGADFLLAQRIEKAISIRTRKALLSFSVLMNIGLLVYFKYANFFLDSLEQTLRSAGAEVSLPTLKVILPIGISFYTFEAINYIVDVYRGRLKAEKNLAHFLLFILFFPHLIAGPIVRARDFLPQINRPKRWDWARFTLGGWLFILGLFMKLALADRMALIVDPVFENPERFDAQANWMAAIGFAIQVFCDFSGYTNMALGTAHMLGYKLTPNFAMPFLSRNLGEFWRRWHMSLSSWLRDYLFIPLGGSRGSTLFVCRNLIITMTIGGLWHGANWNMVLWGTLMGLLLCLHRIFNLFIQPWPSFNSFLRSTYLTPICVGCTLLLFVLSLVVFRTPSLRATGFMFEGLLGGQGTQAAPLPLRSLLVTILLLIVGHAWGVYLRDNRFAWRRLFRTAPPSLLGFAYAGMVTLAIVLGPGSSKAFIYFQF